MTFMEKDYYLVSYSRDLLIRAVPVPSSSVIHCILKGWLHGLGNHLNVLPYCQGLDVLYNSLVSR